MCTLITQEICWDKHVQQGIYTTLRCFANTKQVYFNSQSIFQNLRFAEFQMVHVLNFNYKTLCCAIFKHKTLSNIVQHPNSKHLQFLLMAQLIHV